jgi:hypothetical protein
MQTIFERFLNTHPQNTLCVSERYILVIMIHNRITHLEFVLVKFHVCISYDAEDTEAKLRLGPNIFSFFLFLFLFPEATTTRTIYLDMLDNFVFP